MLNKKDFAAWFKTTSLSETMSLKEARKNYMNAMRAEGWYEKHDVYPYKGSNQTHTVWVKDEMHCHGDVKMTTTGNQVYQAGSGWTSLADIFYPKNSLVSLSETPTPVPYSWDQPVAAPMTECTAKPKQEKNAMAYGDKNVNIQLDIHQQTAKFTEAAAASHLLDRLDNIRYTKRNELEKKFNIYGSDTPKTYEELIAAIKAGDYTIDSKVQKRLELAKEGVDGDFRDFDDGDVDSDTDSSNFYWGFGALYGIKFTKLPNAPDHKGYQAAIKALNAEFTKAQDEIKILPATDGLAALRAFEAWTPTTETKH